MEGGEKNLSFRVMSWNVNGLKPLLAKHNNSLLDLIIALGSPEILMLQETKIEKKDVITEQVTAQGYVVFLSCSKTRGGYSGVTIYP